MIFVFFVCVKFGIQKSCPYKRNDKYHTWTNVDLKHHQFVINYIILSNNSFSLLFTLSSGEEFAVWCLWQPVNQKLQVKICINRILHSLIELLMKLPNIILFWLKDFSINVYIITRFMNRFSKDMYEVDETDLLQ